MWKAHRNHTAYPPRLNIISKPINYPTNSINSSLALFPLCFALSAGCFIILSYSYRFAVVTWLARNDSFASLEFTSRRVAIVVCSRMEGPSSSVVSCYARLYRILRAVRARPAGRRCLPCTHRELASVSALIRRLNDSRKSVGGRASVCVLGR